jgi:hypothetical protein
MKGSHMILVKKKGGKKRAGRHRLILVTQKKYGRLVHKMIRVPSRLVKRHPTGPHKLLSKASNTHVKKHRFTTTNNKTSHQASVPKHKHHHKHHQSHSKSINTSSSSTSTSGNSQRLIINLTPIKYSQLRLIAGPTATHLIPDKYDQLTPKNSTPKKPTKFQKLTLSMRQINLLLKNKKTGIPASSNEYQKQKDRISQDKKIISKIHHEMIRTNLEIRKNSRFLNKNNKKPN